MALEISTSPAGNNAAAHNSARTAPRFVVARRALVIVTAAIMVDLMTVFFSYAIARAAWPWHRLPDLGLLAKVHPLILATIPCWLAVFYAFGLYSRKQVLEPSLRLKQLLGAITASIFLMIVVLFAFNVESVHRGWIVTLWVVSTALVVSGRLLMLLITQNLHEEHWLAGPSS